MAKQNHTRVRRVSKDPYKDRFLTVTLYPESYPTIPWLRVKGRWLEGAGFTERTRVRVRVRRGRLVLTVVAHDDANPATHNH